MLGKQKSNLYMLRMSLMEKTYFQESRKKQHPVWKTEENNHLRQRKWHQMDPKMT